MSAGAAVVVVIVVLMALVTACGMGLIAIAGIVESIKRRKDNG